MEVSLRRQDPLHDLAVGVEEFDRRSAIRAHGHHQAWLAIGVGERHRGVPSAFTTKTRCGPAGALARASGTSSRCGPSGKALAALTAFTRSLSGRSDRSDLQAGRGLTAALSIADTDDLILLELIEHQTRIGAAALSSCAERRPRLHTSSLKSNVPRSAAAFIVMPSITPGCWRSLFEITIRSVPLASTTSSRCTVSSSMSCLQLIG